MPAETPTFVIPFRVDIQWPWVSRKRLESAEKMQDWYCRQYRAVQAENRRLRAEIEDLKAGQGHPFAEHLG